ncbi:MAG TPA: MlaD family protein [Nocardia sp.]|uniref:MlaD family protein n=1 Tax=Nocardia TaxID=1817 RepID=UPI002458EA7A|nr:MULTISPECIES: MlaD family protein [Nocardia]HLS76729.1 MlaD family protein [Nocardia sp.]
MPVLTSHHRLASPRRRPRTGPEDPGTDLRWGVAGMCLAVLLVAVIGLVYVRGTESAHTYTAEIAQAGQIREGDDVRLAGIPVGKVKSLDLLADRVRMTFTVADEVFVGDRTALSVRMLTVVGGYYLALEPAGVEPLGSQVIPRERVTLPYTLTQVFQAAIEPVSGLDGELVRENLDAVAAAVGGSPEAVRAAITATEDLAEIMDRQNADISRAIALAEEYLTAMSGASEVLAQLVRNLGTLQTIVQTYKSQVAQALYDVSAVLGGLAPLGWAWDETVRERAQPLAELVPRLTELGDRMGVLLDSLITLGQRLLPLAAPEGGVAVDHSGASVALPGLCVPVPGGGC